MEVGHAEMRDFLAATHPFDLLPEQVLAALPDKLSTVRVDGGSTILEPGQDSRSLFLVRTGAVEICSPDGQLLTHLSEGAAFGVRALHSDRKAPYRAAALEDTVLHLLPDTEFARLKREHPEFDQYFAPMGAERLRGTQPGTGAADQTSLLSVRTSDLMTGPPVTIARDASLRTAARRMREHGISCLLVTEGESLAGILTSRDLRDRVVAEAVDYDTPVDKVMTPEPVTLPADSLAFDALLTMTERNISHLPVTDEGRPVGMITSTDLVRRQANSAVYLVADIHKQRTTEGLAKAVAQIPQLLVSLVDSGATADNIGHIVTSICDATTTRLLQMAEAEFGPPPVPYAWLASGSQARQEQTGVSDQDNCLVMDDAFDEAEHGPYFEALAKYVCDGLDACGYIYCPGEMMAMTPMWRQPLKQWQRYFASWIVEPEPMAQMLTSVLFDLRPIGGEARLFDEIQKVAVSKAQRNSIFLAHLVSNALTHTPPLGFFRNFVLIRGGEHDRRFDLKHNGTVPIIDIARVYALKAGLTEVNTRDRLVAAQAASALSVSGARDLLDVYEFISITRLRHQAKQIRDGQKPDNFMAPQDMSQFERDHLKDAFLVVKKIQSNMSNAHQIGAR